MGAYIAMIGEKLGMCTRYDASGRIIPLTLIRIENNLLLSLRCKSRDGYNALVLSGGRHLRDILVSKPQLAQFQKLSLSPSRIIKEVRLPNDLDFEEAIDPLVHHFPVSDYLEGAQLDITAISRGKGFQGPMKRHGFKGLGASHGVSVSHRSHGSTGQRQDPGKVFKGKKMAGRMGGKIVAVQNLLVDSVDKERGLIALRGTIPGHQGSMVFIRDTVKLRKSDCTAFNGIMLDQLVNLKVSASC